MEGNVREVGIWEMGMEDLDLSVTDVDDKGLL